MKTIALGLILSIASINTAHAGFEKWTTTAKNNPFSGGVDVSVLYNVSCDGHIQVRCDSGEQGITIVAIPGYEANDNVLLYEPDIKIAIDGKIILTDISASVGAFGANLVGVIVKLTKQNADKLTDGFLSAQRQIAFEDGLSSKPFLLTARGSTAAAKKIKQCYQAQKGNAAAPLADEDSGKSERIAEIKIEIEKLTKELEVLER